MSVFSLVAIILAISAALLLTQLIPKITGLIALGFTVFTKLMENIQAQEGKNGDQSRCRF